MNKEILNEYVEDLMEVRKAVYNALPAERDTDEAAIAVYVQAVLFLMAKAGEDE